MPKVFLNKKHKEFIHKNYLKISGKDMAKMFGCSGAVVNKYKRESNLIVPKDVMVKLRSKKLLNRTSFTPEMDLYLKQNYLTMPIKRIGKHIGKSYTGIRIRMRQLGLEIPAETIEVFKQQSRFKKGHQAHNKGVAIKDWMCPEQQKNFLKNSFKKGHQPHNIKPIGWHRLTKDGYVEVKIKDGVFELKQRLVWKQVHGYLSDNKIIAFKDGNKINFEITNLECISKAENMLRNSINNYPKDIKKAIRLISKLNKEI